MNIKYDVKCYPVIPVKICEGGWQLPEVLRSYENCDVTPVTGAIEEVEVYCSGKQQGVNIVKDNTIISSIDQPLGIDSTSKVIDIIDTSVGVLLNKNTVRWMYNITNKTTNDARAGSIVATWHNDQIVFDEKFTNDIGDTNDIEFNVTIENNIVNLIIISSSSEWNIKVNREVLI